MSTNITELHQLLVEGEVKIRFIKKDKSVRDMTCTLCRKNIPNTVSDDKIAIAIAGNNPNSNISTVWDTREKNWRRFGNSTVEILK
jgi:hypothetical protein